MKFRFAFAVVLLLTGLFGCSSPAPTPSRLPSPPEPDERRLRPVTALRHAEDLSPPPLQLRSPRRPPAERQYADPARPRRVSGRLSAPLRRDWKYIIIHHSATDCGSKATFDRYHREQNGWRGVGYDFVIGNGRGAPDGVVEVTFRWEKQIDGAHANHPTYNKYGIGICLVGNFEKARPTEKQMRALVALVNYLQERCRIPTRNVLGHRHVRPDGTRCPGKNFPWYEFLSRLKH